MRTIGLFGVALLAFTATACAKGGTTATPKTPSTDAAATSTDGSNPIATSGNGNGDGDGSAWGTGKEAADIKAATSSTWIGAAGEGDMMAIGTRDTFLGIWVDVPQVKAQGVRPPMELALVVDTSGSMAGAKIENARTAAKTLVNSLRDGDIVALDSFSDSAKTVVPPTRLDSHTRAEILRAIGNLSTAGSTNMFEGLTLGEGQVAAAPMTHTLRRVVVISDGKANVGPSTPEVLGMLAERGMRNRVQVTSIGVGNDYDESTLNALAVKSSGRLYHLSEPKEMASILKNEVDLLNATLASDSFVEVVPAPGVQLTGADGIRADWHEGGSLRIPLGALHAGQHREALVKVRIVDAAAFEGHTRPLASVRLRFRDASDGDLERIQEVVARTQLTGDEAGIARTMSSRTKAIMAINESSRFQLAASQQITSGDFGNADRELERAQKALQAQASVVQSAPEKKRLEQAAGEIASARAATKPMAAAPKAVQRDHALKMNAKAMHDAGF